MKSKFDERIILHVDINNCYASIEAKENPDLTGKSVAVAGSVKDRHGIILAKNEIAKSFGVKTGEAIWEAKRKCPELVVTAPHYDLYLKYSKAARKIYSDYTDRVEPFGIDEAWLDITGLYRNGSQADGEEIADEIRKRVKRELGITVSVGVSFNKIYAKLGSDMKKPDAVTVITKENFKKKVWPLDVGAILFVGKKTRERLRSRGVFTVGDLAHADDAMLRCILGKNGQKLKDFACGLDKSEVAIDGDGDAVKSVSNSTTAPRDLCNDKDVKVVLYSLSESVASRLRDINKKASVVTVSVRTKTLKCYSKQRHISVPTNDAKTLATAAFELYRESFEKSKGEPIRSMGVSAGELSGSDGFVQLSMFDSRSEYDECEKLNAAVDKLRQRYGKSCITRGIILSDGELSHLAEGHHIGDDMTSFMKSG